MRLIKTPKLLHLRGNSLYTVAMLGSGTGMFSWGYDSTLANMLSANPDFFKTFPLLKENATVLGLTFALMTLGLVVGAGFNTVFGNRWGRRDAVLISAFGMAVFSIPQAVATNLATLCVARLLGTFAGITMTSSPAYIAELSRTATRPLLLLLNVVNGLGLCTGFWLSWPFSKITTSGGWRGPAWLQAAIPLIAGIIYIAAPESPRYLLELGQQDEAMSILRDIHHTEADAQHAFNEIQASLELERSMHVKGLKALFAKNEQCYRYRTFCVYVINMASQAAGPAVITYYAGNIFVSIGLTGDSIFAALGGLGTVAVTMMLLGSFASMKFGRVPLLMISSSLSAVGMMFVALSVSHIGTSWGPKLGALGMYFAFGFYAFAYIPIQATYAAEIAPLQIRPQMISTGQFFQSIVNFVIIMASPKGFESLGWKYYLPFIAASAAVVPIYYIYLPETAGVELERIDELFVDGKVTVRRSVKSEVGRKPTGTHGLEAASISDVREDDDLKA